MARRLPAFGRRGAASPAASRAPGLLAQLPDFVAGSEALEAGRFADALQPLRRATEVAAAYFPEAAAQEKALCHSAYGRCLWYSGHYADTATQFEAGLWAARGGAPAAAVSRLAAAAARAHFEAGRLDAAAPLAAEAVAAAPSAAEPRLVAAALVAARGASAAEELEAEAGAEAVRRTNRLIAEVLPAGVGLVDGKSAAAALESELAEGGALARLLAHDSEVAPLTLMALRSTAGQLAIAAGQGVQPWARPLLVAALDDFDALQPGGPTLRPVLFRTLGALGTLTGGGGSGDAITAEGLFTTAVGHVEEAVRGPLAVALDGGRGRLWRAQLFLGFADLLASGRRAEHRASEIAALRGRAAAALAVDAEADAGLTALSPEQLRWALVYLPPPESLRAEELFVE